MKAKKIKTVEKSNIKNVFTGTYGKMKLIRDFLRTS